MLRDPFPSSQCVASTLRFMYIRLSGCMFDRFFCSHKKSRAGRPAVNPTHIKHTLPS